MKAIFYFIALVSYVSISQNYSTYTVTENGMMTANPKFINEFELGVFNHNNKYHTDGQFGARIYQINNGLNMESNFGLWDRFPGVHLTSVLS